MTRLVSRVSALRDAQMLRVVAAASALLGVVANRRGIGISWDSTDYVSVGLSMSAGRGVLDVTGQPMVIRPP